MNVNRSAQRLARYDAIIKGQSHSIVDRAARVVLWLGQAPYGSVISLRNLAYNRNVFKSIRVPVPVVCIGNLSTGGTGKTPTVEWAARVLRDDDRRPAILSRGYGSEHGPNDEAMLLEENLPEVPHLQGKDRVTLALLALEELESDVLVLDDGFQHRRLARDLNIITIDAVRPPHQDYLLPRGTLREPLSALRRAHGIILTRVDQAAAEVLAELHRVCDKIVPHIPRAETSHAPLELIGRDDGEVEAIESLVGKKVLLFSGIARPDAFEATVLSLGAVVLDRRDFADHHAYTRVDVEALSEWAAAQSGSVLVLTTQKDFVKLRVSELGGYPLRALRISLKFRQGEAELKQLLCDLPRIEEE